MFQLSTYRKTLIIFKNLYVVYIPHICSKIFPPHYSNYKSWWYTNQNSIDQRSAFFREKYAKWESFGESISDNVFANNKCDLKHSFADLDTCYTIAPRRPRVDVELKNYFFLEKQKLAFLLISQSGKPFPFCFFLTAGLFSMLWHRNNNYRRQESPFLCHSFKVNLKSRKKCIF